MPKYKFTYHDVIPEVKTIEIEADFSDYAQEAVEEQSEYGQIEIINIEIIK